MALTNRHRLYVLISILVITDIFSIVVMINTPDDIMDRETAQAFVELVGGFIPEVKNIQNIKRALPIMPFFYAVINPWCLAMSVLLVFVTVKTKGYRFCMARRLISAGPVKMFFLMTIFFFLMMFMFFFNPTASRSSFSDIIMYESRIGAAILGPIFHILIYFCIIWLLLNFKLIFIDSMSISRRSIR